MVTMSLLPERRALTRADLEALPDDGHRYELIDGSLIVTPSPVTPHQVAVVELIRALQAACTPSLYVLTARADVVLADDTVLQPDVLIVPLQAVTDGLDHRPLLVVEVLSPSTRRIDLTLKKDRYEAAGTPAYWVVDHDVPSITAWTMRDGRYGEPVVVVGEEELSVSEPFELTIRPSQLTL